MFGDKGKGIDGDAEDIDPKMQVRAGHAPGRAHEADLLSGLDHLTRFHIEAGHVRIGADDALPVIEVDGIPAKYMF